MNTPSASERFKLTNGEEAVVEVFEHGGIGCEWCTRATTETPNVSVRATAEQYIITLTHSSGMRFEVEVARGDTAWAVACARFRPWREMT